MFSEIRNDFYDEDEGCYYVDVWFTCDDSEPGITIAKVYRDRVEYTNEDYKDCLQVLEAINETKGYFEE